MAGEWCPPFHRDTFNAPGKAMVNRAFADGYGADLAGRHFKFDQTDSDQEIVGIVGTLIEDGPGAQPLPYVYVCGVAGGWPDPDYVVRAEGDPRLLLPSIPVIIIILAFNFLGDGLRDAADPYN